MQLTTCGVSFQNIISQIEEDVKLHGLSDETMEILFNIWTSMQDDLTSGNITLADSRTLMDSLNRLGFSEDMF